MFHGSIGRGGNIECCIGIFARLNCAVGSGGCVYGQIGIHSSNISFQIVGRTGTFIGNIYQNIGGFAGVEPVIVVALRVTDDNAVIFNHRRMSCQGEAGFPFIGARDGKHIY